MKVGDYDVRVINVLQGEMYTWESQVSQYPSVGFPGKIAYYEGDVDGYDTPVDCLLWRDNTGQLRGILNHYAIDYPPFEKAGNVNIWVDPAWKRRGIATDLMRRSIELYGPLKVEQQKYSREGVKLLTSLIEKGIVE